MLTPDLDALVTAIPFAQLPAARARLLDLAGEPAEMLALARVSDELQIALESCPDSDRALNNLERFVHARGSRLALYHLFAQHPAALDALVRIVAASQYLADVLVRNPEYFDLVSDSALLQAPRREDHLTGELSSATGAFRSTEAKLNAIRRFHRRELLRIGAADLLDYFDLVTTTQQLAALADAMVRECLRVVTGKGDGCGLTVLAFGKLGGES